MANQRCVVVRDGDERVGGAFSESDPRSKVKTLNILFFKSEQTEVLKYLGLIRDEHINPEKALKS